MNEMDVNENSKATFSVKSEKRIQIKHVSVNVTTFQN